MSSFCLILFILMASCHEYHKDIVFVSLMDKINKRISEYLNYLNSRPGATLKWKTSHHLYWIEITLVRKRREPKLQRITTS